MGDSLDNFFNKAGEKVSSIFNKKVKIDGSEKFSGFYVGPAGGGVSRTDGSDAIGYEKNPNPSPGQKSPAKSIQDDTGRPYPAGFTPLAYIKSDSEVKIFPSGSIIGDMGDKFEKNSSSFNNGIGVGGLSDGIGGFDDTNQYDFKYSMDKFENWPNDSPPLKPSGKNEKESFDGSYSDRSWDSAGNYEFNKNAVNWSNGTPYENEDPVYFGFDVTIDSLNSPLLNGESDKFIEMFGSLDEVASRSDILKSFQLELSKFFKFNSDKLEESNFFGTKLRKRHYVKKVNGLDKLIESNGAKSSRSFTKYKDDTIKISFYEDTLLSTGTLASLYKLLYWSRINGKNIIPENLLRFDCEVIVSEVRNIARVRKAISSSDNLNLEVLRENVSRYVYKIYECQFHFENMTHPSDIDMESISPSQNWEIEISFKYSDMRFERFVFDGDYGGYKSLWNGQLDPKELKPIVSDDAIITASGISLLRRNNTPIKVNDDINGLSGLVADTTSDTGDILGDLKDNLKSENRNRLGDVLKESGVEFLDKIKTAALNETQRQLNNQFRLLNDSLDKIRNSFGIGRMSEPTNVYKQGFYGSRFFFDVHNALRGFAGDTLGGML